MSSSLPTPVAALLGIVPTALDSARRIPGRVVQIPVLAISTALTTLETARRQYGELAERGERVVSRVHGGGFDGMEAWADTLVEETPLAAVEEAAEDAVAKVTALLDRAAERKPVRPTVVETAAAPEVVEVVEEVVAASTASSVEHDALPLADYDHMTLGALRGRLRSLSVDELVQVRDYEKGHGHRLPVVTLLDNRIAKLATEAASGPADEASAPTVTTPTPVKKPAAKKAPAKKAPAKKDG